MLLYAIRRVLLVIPTLFVVSIIVFSTIRLLPGDIVDSIERTAAMAGGGIDREAVEHALGLDVPMHVQYGRWMDGIFLHGSLGVSLRSGEEITAKIVSRMPVTIELGIISIIMSLLLGLPIGVYSAIRQDTIGDYLARSLSIILIAVPSFWSATMVILYPSIWWGWSPPIEFIPFHEDPLGNLGQMLIPSFLTGMLLSGLAMRMTRTMMLEEMRKDYIRTAFSKGLSERLVITRHALKNAFIPVISILGLEIPILVGGAIIIEQIFNLPGMGRLLLEALHSKDYTLTSGINLIIATSIVGSNLLVDLSYAYFDPRVRYR
jgi:peptide/nickel transport system permease protein